MQGHACVGGEGHETGPPLTLPSSSFYDSTFSRSSTRTWQALSLPASAREGQMALQLCTGAHRAPRLSRRHREALLLTAAGRGALPLGGTAGSTTRSERPPESG